MNRKGLLSVLVFCVLVGSASAQSSGDTTLDNLFNDNPGSTSSPADTQGTGSSQGASQSNGSSQSQGSSPSDGSTVAPDTSVRPDDVIRDNKIHYFGTLDIYGLLGPGWSRFPPLDNLRDGLGNELGGSLSATLGVEVRPAPELRLRGTLSYNFPAAGTQLSELIVDYSVRSSAFFRFGIYDYTWSVSQFFQFSNLPSRALAGWGISNIPIWQQANIINQTVPTTRPVSVKMYVPFGVNGLTLLSRFDMTDYGFPDPNTPDPRDAGYGFQLDLVTGPIEWTLGGFWQRLLTPRSSLAMKTSLLGFDLSVETTMAFPVSLTLDTATAITTTGGGIYVGGLMQRIYPTVVAGLAREWVDSRIKLYLEYAYNGERDPGTSWLADETGPGGHNSVVALRFSNLWSSQVTLNVLWQHNWSDGSGLASPLFEFSPVPLTTIQFGPVLVYGPDHSEVINNRIVPGSKRLEMLLLVKISDSYRQ